MMPPGMQQIIQSAEQLKYAEKVSGRLCSEDAQIHILPSTQVSFSL